VSEGRLWQTDRRIHAEVWSDQNRVGQEEEWQGGLREERTNQE